MQPCIWARAAASPSHPNLSPPLRWALGPWGFLQAARKVQTLLRPVPERTESLGLSQRLFCFLEERQVSGITPSGCEQEESMPRGRVCVPLRQKPRTLTCSRVHGTHSGGGGAFVWAPLHLSPPASRIGSPLPALGSSPPRQGMWPQVAQGPLCCPAGWRPREAQHLPECPLSAGPHLSGCRTLSPCLDSRKSKLGSFMGRKGLRASRDSGLWEQAPSWGSRSIPSAVFSVLNMDLGDSYF